MKVVILAGGLGTRLSEETALRPKPMVEIGGQPILWHIMKTYMAHGLNEFVICLGYRGYLIKEYFANYLLHASDVTIDTASGSIDYHETNSEPWRVTLVDTGANTMTGGRLKRVASYLPEGQPFCMTYGDGVADIDISQEIAFHQQRNGTGCFSGPRKLPSTVLMANLQPWLLRSRQAAMVPYLCRVRALRSSSKNQQATMPG